MKRPPGKRASFFERYAPALLGAGVSLFVFVLYLRTLAPTVLYYDPHGLFDSVMLQVRAYVLGIPNPTGYPTYIMLAHLFTYLPFGNVAYRVNLASAVFGVVAVFVIFSLCRRLTGRLAPSAAAALLFGVSQAFWSQAVIAEVYTLNILLVSLVMLVLFIWRETRKDGHLLLAVFLMGLSLTHHLTSGLLIPAGLLFVALVNERKLLEWRLALKGAGLFLLGLTPYLYLPIRSSMKPPLNEAKPSELDNFVALVTGSRFEDRMFVYGLAELPERFGMYVHYLTQQFHPAFLVVSLLGFACLLFRDRSALALFGFLYGGWLFFALEYSIMDVRLYFIPTYLILCLLISAGLALLLSGAERVVESVAPHRKATVVLALAALMVLSTLSGVLSSYQTADRSDALAGRRTIEAVAENAKRGATVLHHNSSLVYMKLVERRRSDLKLMDPFEPGKWTERSSKWVQAAEARLQEGPVYVIFPRGSMVQNVSSFTKAGYRLVPDKTGTFYEVVRR